MKALSDINFKEMRKGSGLTLREVEEIVGISNAYLSQLETGKIKSPSYEIVRKLCTLYQGYTDMKGNTLEIIKQFNKKSFRNRDFISHLDTYSIYEVEELIELIKGK